MNENLNSNKRVINKEQFQQILEIIDNNSGLDREQIKEKLTKIVGEPQSDEEATENYRMIEIIYNGMSRSGSMAQSELTRIERMLDEIEQAITGCCQLKVELLKILQNRKKWEINDAIMKSEHPKRILAKFCLFEKMNKQLCSSCQEIKSKLVDFANIHEEKQLI